MKKLKKADDIDKAFACVKIFLNEVEQMEKLNLTLQDEIYALNDHELNELGNSLEVILLKIDLFNKEDPDLQEHLHILRKMIYETVKLRKRHETYAQRYIT